MDDKLTAKTAKFILNVNHILLLHNLQSKNSCDDIMKVMIMIIDIITVSV